MGALMQLVAIGAQDIYLTGNPQITFFKVVYKRHTNFSMETIQNDHVGKAGFGQRVEIEIPRNGDLIGRTYVEIKLSGDKTKQSNRVGYALIKLVDVSIGGQKIDEHTGTWLNLWTELTHTNDQKRLIDEMVGDQTHGRRINLGEDLTNAGGAVRGLSSVYVPLQFSFCRNPGLALPLIALQYHSVRIGIDLADSVNDVTKRSASGDLVIDSLALHTDFIYLDAEERTKFAGSQHEYLYEQVQYASFNLSGTAINSKDLSFNHPVKELVWVAKNDTPSANASDTGDMFSNYGLGVGSESNEVPLKECNIRINGQNRLKKQSANYFCNVQPYQHHTGCPQTGIYCYSFALKPEEHQPSGTMNFSRLDSIRLEVVPKSPSAGKINKLFVYAVNYNVLRIKSGMGGLAYSN